MEYIATWEERDRYQNMLVVRCKDGKNSGNVSIRDDFKFAARSLAVASFQEGKRNFYIPRGGRFRQRPLNEQLQADLEWRSLTYREIYGSQASSSATWWESGQ